jgi:hypothetical protein
VEKVVFRITSKRISGDLHKPQQTAYGSGVVKAERKRRWHNWIQEPKLNISS